MLQTDFTKVKLARQSDFKILYPTDEYNCLITDLAVLPDDLLLLADQNNKSMKLADPASGQLLDKLRLPGSPHGLCLLPGDRAAATIQTKSLIQTISVASKKLVRQDVINVIGECFGIASVEDCFVVGLNSPAKVALVDRQESIYKSISEDSQGKTLFKHPHYICVTTETAIQVIYVSDYGTKTITRLSVELQVLQSFTDPALNEPCGLVPVGGRQLLIVNPDFRSTLSVLDITTEQFMPLLGEKEDLYCTYCVAVSHTLETVSTIG